MREIANRFSDQMDMICHYIDFITAAIKLTKVPREGLRSGHGFVVAASSSRMQCKKSATSLLLPMTGPI